MSDSNALENIGLSFIRTDGGTQARAGLDEATVIEYADAMREGVEFPPVVLFYDGTDYWLGDGFHRVEARRRLKDEGQSSVIAVDLRQGTRRDAVLFAAQANASHGLRRSADDKRRAVMCLLNDEEWGRWSDREIARRCHVSPTLVGRLRGEVVTVHVDSEPVERTYTTRHGTEAVMKTGNIGNGAAAYEAIHSLQNFVLVWVRSRFLASMDVAAVLQLQIETLDAMKQDHKDDRWPGLNDYLAGVGKVFRVNDLRQALNNTLDSLRFRASQIVINQPSEPATETELPESLEQCLLGALRRMAAPAVWEEWREKGITNEQLREMLSYGWALGGGTSGPGTVSEYHKGGANPRFWYNAWGPNGNPTLQGAALIAKAREVLEMPFPQPATEPVAAAEEPARWWCAAGCGRELPPEDIRQGLEFCRECKTVAPVLNEEQPKPRIASYVMGYFQTANEAIARIATAIPKARTDDIHDMMTLLASLERMEKRVAAEYDLN